MNSKEVSAVNLFKNNFNCAQSVLLTYSKDFNLEDKVGQGISCGFGGGMGRLQETCGAVTGAFMVIGLFNNNKYSEIKDIKENAYKMIKEFDRKFKEIYNTTSCKLLLNCDLNTEEGQEYVKANNLHEKVCEKCIIDSVKILEKMIN